MKRTPCIRVSLLKMLACGALVGVGGLSVFAAGPKSYQEAWTPVTSMALPSGLHGKAVKIERMDERDVGGDESVRMVKGCAWRNERVNAQFLIWSGDGAKALRPALSDFKGEHGGTIPASCASVRFVRYVRAAFQTRDGKPIEPERMMGDMLDTAAYVDLPPNGFRPVWVTFDVPKDVIPDCYTASLSFTSQDGKAITFSVSIDVLHDVLPDSAAWKFHLDLWQHPWAVARYHGVKPFSPEHYALMRPLYEELARGGQKAITATLVDLPWNHQNFDAYWSLIDHERQADGSYKRDYRIFDEYVAFAKSCGVGPQIHCYTMASWGNVVYYRQAGQADKVKVTLKPGTPEHEAFWGPFLQEFQKHLAEKGWLHTTYIALDERSREELMVTAACIQKYAPALKLQMAGNKPPSTFQGIQIDSYSQTMQYGYITPEFLKEAAARRARGLVTTSYICCAPKIPNTFTTSSLAEARFLGIYAAARGLDGMLRWAAFNWPENPMRDSTYGNWRAGDTFLLYPDARASTRWEALRDSIENFEKIRILQDSRRATWVLPYSWNKWDYKMLKDASAAVYDTHVEAVENAIVAMSCPGFQNGRRIECFERMWGDECGYKTPVSEMHLVVHPKDNANAKGRPLYVVLHSSGHNAVSALRCTKSPDNHDIYNSPNDFYSLFLDCKTAPDDWWWGYNGCPGFELSSCEKRMLKTIEEVVVKYGIDRNRIYLCGNSMGGSGCLGFGLRHGDVFAAIKGNVPALVAHACDRMGWDFKADKDSQTADLAHLPEPPLLIDHTAPNDMRWSEGHEHLFRMMHARKYPFMAYWADHKHCNKNSIILAANDMVHSLDWTQIRKDDILPAFTDAQTDTPCPWPNNRLAPGAGQANGFFRWAKGSASTHELVISLFLTSQKSRHFTIPETTTATVTLWRTGAFKVKPGDVVSWIWAGKSGQVTVGQDGRVTIPALTIAKTEQVLKLTR